MSEPPHCSWGQVRVRPGTVWVLGANIENLVLEKKSHSISQGHMEDVVQGAGPKQKRKLRGVLEEGT